MVVVVLVEEVEVEVVLEELSGLVVVVLLVVVALRNWGRRQVGQLYVKRIICTSGRWLTSRQKPTYICEIDVNKNA